jgi:uncharacterized membrane protein
MNHTRLALIVVFLLVSIISSFDWGPVVNMIVPVLSVITLFIVSWLHGSVRYGAKNMTIFFLITWLVSHSFEVLSIQTGFPFGHYYYDRLGGPRIFQVPIVIMFAYFSMAYLSWTLSRVLLRQYSQKLTPTKFFLVPLIASFIMVMWDLCMDPLSSTIASLWVWKEGGAYFGVPLQNYFGWFLVVYIIFQSFAFYISKEDAFNLEQLDTFSEKTYWMEASVLYGIQGVVQILSAFVIATNREIYGSMALVTIFTMIFVSLLSFITIQDSQELDSY